MFLTKKCAYDALETPTISPHHYSGAILRSLFFTPKTKNKLATSPQDNHPLYQHPTGHQDNSRHNHRLHQAGNYLGNNTEIDHAHRTLCKTGFPKTAQPGTSKSLGHNHADRGGQNNAGSITQATAITTVGTTTSPAQESAT